MPKTPACNLRAIAKYQEKNVRRVVMNVNRVTRPKLLAHLESQPNIQGYILSLIEEDMRRQGIPTDEKEAE